jgi:hypothetical protein
MALARCWPRFRTSNGTIKPGLDTQYSQLLADSASNRISGHIEWRSSLLSKRSPSQGQEQEQLWPCECSRCQ